MPVVCRRASDSLVMPWSFICFCVTTLTDCGVSRGDSSSPVVVLISDVV